MPLARIDEVVDGVAAAITDLWAPVGPDEVVVDDDFKIVTDPSKADVITGRKVYVLPESYDTPEPASRGEDFQDYGVVVLIAKLYTDGGRPTKAWVRAERYWVEQNIYLPLTDPRNVLLPESDSGGLYAVAPSGVDPPYDVDELRERKLFLSLVRLTFREEG